MRWMFAETAEEQAERQRVLAAIDTWWEGFRASEPEILRHIALQSDLDLPAFMAKLSAIRPGIAWEFGPVEGGHRLAITAEQKYHLAPIAEEIVKRAPALPGWEFFDHRPPWPTSWASNMMAVRAGQPCDGWHVIVTHTPVGHKLQLRFLVPDCKRSEDPEVRGRALVVIEVLLGEKVLRDWVGPILVDPLPRQRAFLLFGKTTVGTPNSIPIEQLAERASAEIEAIRGILSEQPLFQRFRDELPQAAGKVEVPYWMYQSKPTVALDYADQDDLYVSTGQVEGLYQGVRAGAFSSRTFSRAGEIFCYLKIDGSAGLAGSAYADRCALEEELDEKLSEAKLGCTVGGGSGLRYSYTELALLELPRALELVRQVLRAGRAPVRTWILFHDATMASEWLGLYPETPPPPVARPGDPPEVRPNLIHANLAAAEAAP
jgi:hypothetical protein